MHRYSHSVNMFVMAHYPKQCLYRKNWTLADIQNQQCLALVLWV